MIALDLWMEPLGAFMLDQRPNPQTSAEFREAFRPTSPDVLRRRDVTLTICASGGYVETTDPSGLATAWRETIARF